MNPLTSPWNNSNTIFIPDKTLSQRWFRISRHLTSKPQVYEYKGMLTIKTSTNTIYIAKNSSKMRLHSHLDWVYYTPKTLAQAIELDTLDSYYEIMMAHVQSDPNEWKDHDFEMELKSFYAARANRATLI